MTPLAGARVSAAPVRSAPAADARPRLDVSAALDVLRGLAAVAMVVNHTAAQLVDPAVVRGEAWAVFMASSAAPVLFFFVSGVAAALRPADGPWWRRLDTVLLLLLADQFFAWQHRTPWGLDFFAFIGLSALCADLIAPRRHAVALALAAALGLVLLRFVGAPLLALHDGQLPLLAWAVGLPAVDHVSYPLAPWLCYALLGLAAGRWCGRRAEAPPLWPVLAGLLAAGALCGGAAWLAAARGLAMNRWMTVGAGYFMLSLAILAGAIAIAALWVRWSRRGGDAVRLRGVAAFAVVPLHFALIAVLRALGVEGLGLAGFALAAVALVLAALQLARLVAGQLRHAAQWPGLRAATAALVALCAAALWLGPWPLAPLAGQALVLLAQLSIAAWMLPRPAPRAGPPAAPTRP